MFTLTPEQVQRLSAIARERAMRRLGVALATAFPELAARAGERLPALVAHGVERAAGHGLDDGLCVARYLACWCVWGADFESQPGHEWARTILGQASRGQGAKVFQLCRRTADDLLQQGAPGLPTSAAFQAAVSLLDERLADVGVLGSLVPTPPIRLGVPCDIDACDIRLVDVGWRQSYRVVAGQWQRLPSPPNADAVTAVAATREPGAGAEPAALPSQLHLLSLAPGEGAAARLRLRSRATHACDAHVHPQVTLNGTHGFTSWRGPFAAEVLLALPAEPAAPPAAPNALQPTLGAEIPPSRLVLEATACGLRETGAPLGTLATQVAVYPATQWLLAWQREPATGVSEWSAGTSPEAGRSNLRCRLEREGRGIDAARWQAGLHALDEQWADALSGLLVVWERVAGVTQGRVQADSSLLAGSAGLSWGWAEGPRGLVDAPVLRVEGECDLTACELRLQLSGELKFAGSRSLLQLTVDGTTRLRTAWQRDHAQPDLALALKPAQVGFRHPFQLSVTPLAGDELAIANATGPVVGALVGACGLRQRADGPGLQWFAQVSIEPVSAPVTVHDPLLGLQRLARPLLPALTLLDWSLG